MAAEKAGVNNSGLDARASQELGYAQSVRPIARFPAKGALFFPHLTTRSTVTLRRDDMKWRSDPRKK